MPINQEFWATPKSSKILLLFGLMLIFAFPFYGIVKLGTSTTAIVFASLFPLVPGLYLINCGRKIKNNLILVVTESEITIQVPFNRTTTVPFAKIKSIENDSNQGLILKTAGRFISPRIPAKMLSPEDRERLIALLNASIKSA